MLYPRSPVQKWYDELERVLDDLHAFRNAHGESHLVAHEQRRRLTMKNLLPDRNPASRQRLAKYQFATHSTQLISCRCAQVTDEVREGLRGRYERERAERDILELR